MPEQVPQHQPQKPIGITAEDVAMIVDRAIEAARRPIVDPVAEAQAERDREQTRASIKRAAELKAARQRACSHLREDGSANIAWCTQSDRQTRGVCQRCTRVFQPGDPDYVAMTRIPHKGVIGEACLAGR